MLQPGGHVQDKIEELLHNLGLMFGYPEEQTGRSPLDSDTDEMLQDVVSDLSSAADEDELESMFEASRDDYEARAASIIAANTEAG